MPDLDNNIDQQWLVILAYSCPNCGYPSVHNALCGFEPTEQFIDQMQLPIVTCVRCRAKHQPLALDSYRHAVQWSLQRYYPPCSEGT
jgi:hypothetical protein